MDLWQMVLSDHANIAELCRETLQATRSGPNSRAELFSDLEDELERHIAVKEKTLYPFLARHERLRGSVAELEHMNQEIRGYLDALTANPDKDGRAWALDFKELTAQIELAFTTEENGLLATARGLLREQGADRLRRAYEREKYAALKASQWNMPTAMRPERYGVSQGTALGVLAGLVTVGGALLLWRGMSHHGAAVTPVRPVHRRPEAPFPLRPHNVRPLGGSSSMGTGSGEGARSMRQGTGDASTSGQPAQENWFSSANPPRAPSGISTPLQPGGTVPAGGPAASVGSIGTGGAQTGNADTGSLKRDGV